MNGSGISWAICKSAPCSRQITMPAPHYSVFYRPDALPVAQATASKHWIHNLTQNTCIVNNSTWWRRTPVRRWHWVVPAPPATLRWWSHQTCPWSARGCDLARSTDTNTSPQSSPEHPAQTPANLEKTALDRGSRSDRLCYCVHTRRWNSTTCHAARLATLARSWRWKPTTTTAINQHPQNAAAQCESKHFTPKSFLAIFPQWLNILK